MPISPNSLRNLKRGERPTKWKHTPTKAVRIPTIFESQILAIAQNLDNGISYAEPCNNRNVQNNYHSILSDILEPILKKIENKESGYKANSASKLIADLKQLMN